MARRRWPSATGPSRHNPSPSGPRLASAATIRATVSMSGVRPSKRTSPPIPQISASASGWPVGPPAVNPTTAL